MAGEDYLVSLKRNDVADESVTLINLKVKEENWPRVHQALEALKNDNPQFDYEAWYFGRKVVNH